MANLVNAATPTDCFVATQSSNRWRQLELPVYLMVTMLIAVRFFTERFVILPRFLNPVDLVGVPLLGLLWMLSVTRIRVTGRPVLWLSGLFLFAWAVAWLVNWKDVNWIGGILLVVGLLNPIVFYLILVNSGFDKRFCIRILRLLNLLLVANLVIGTTDAILGINSGESDFVFGTFGVNQNQLAFFLVWTTSYWLARWRYQGLHRLQTVIMVWSGALFLLCAFQTLWIASALAGAIVFLVLGKVSWRLVRIIALVVLVASLTLSLLNFNRFDIPGRLEEAVTNFNDLGKVELVRNVRQIWQERPEAILFGVGPGTFNSRAFRSIAIIPYAGAGDSSDVAAAIVTPFYTSDLSTRFIIPYFEQGRFFLSGSNTDGPFTSYVSILAEVGLLGAVAIFGIYALTLRALVRSLRRSNDPVHKTLAAWGLIGILMLLGIAGVDNYLETTRYTLLVWLAVAIWRIYSSLPRSVPARA